jgi:PAS domain S-box-containing protein
MTWTTGGKAASGQRRLAAILGGLVLILGLVVLAGWHSQNSRLIQVYPGFKLMAYNTAFSFVLLGSALLALGLGFRALARAVAAVAGVLIGLSLLEYVTGLSLGVSTLFARFTMPAGVVDVTSVAPNTATAIVSLAIAVLLLSGSRGRQWLSTVTALLASAAFALGVNAFLGYLTGFSTFAWGHSTPMAIHTSVGVILLGAGVLTLSWPCIDAKNGGRTFWLLAVVAAPGVITSASFWRALESVERAHIERVIQGESRMPETVLVFGILMTALLGAAVYLAQKVRFEMFLAEQAECARHKADQIRRYLASIVDSSDDAVIGQDLDGTILSWNPGAERIYGYSAAEIVGQSVSALCQPGHGAEPIEICQRIGRGENVARFETERVRKDGTGIQVALTVSPIRESDGRINGVSTIARDVTDRKRTEAALQDSEMAFRALSDAVPQIVWICTPDGLVVYFNQRWVDYTGLTLAESYGTDWDAPFHPDDRQTAWAAWNHATKTGETYCVESRLRAADGAYRWHLMRGLPVRDPEGRITRWFGTCTEIHDLKQAEESLRQLNDKLRQANAYNRSLIEASLDPLVTIAPNGRISDVNEATEHATGLSRQALIGTDFCDYFTDREKARAGYQRAFREGWTRDYELEIRRPDGSTTPILYNASVFRNEAGEPGGVFAAARDITERKRVEEELRELNGSLERRVAQRTADLVEVNQELESFNYSVSHDLRAPLRHIDGFSNILLQEHGDALPEDGRRCIDRIREGARKMGRMVDELLALSRTSRREPSKQLTGLGSLVADVLEELQPEVRDRQIEWRIGELPFADCDPTLTRQVFANLLANAIKFSRRRTPAVIEVGHQVSAGETVLFVRDNGVGFSMKYVDKLFGVFQRLHRSEDFEGTGVGLVTVHRIIHKHGGRIWAEAELEKGATFYFTLEPPGEPPMEMPKLEPIAVFAGEG